MNTNKNMILNNGKNITSDIKFCIYDRSTGRYNVTFNNGQTYPYGFTSIEWIQNPEVLNPCLYRLMHGSRDLSNIQDIRIFRAKAADYWRVCFSDGSERTYNKRDLEVVSSCLSKKEAQNCMGYLRQLASINELKNDDGDVLLQKQYENIEFVGNDTALAIYLNPDEHKIRTYQNHHLVFPFGINASQYRAVENAMHNQLSIIQGPPGTGKTQTILNIIANLLIEGKTIQIVSNNNSATENILEKMASSKYNLGFLIAPLGSSKNKEIFVLNQKGYYPNLSGWEMDEPGQNKLKEKIQSYTVEISKMFERQERLAQVRHELNSLLLEIKYFEEYCSDTGLNCTKIQFRRNLKSETLMRLWQECYEFSEKNRPISFWFKIKSALIYGISDWKFYKNNLPIIITLLQSRFYQARQAELNMEIEMLEKYLMDTDAKRKKDDLIGLSMDYLRAKLFERYGKRTERVSFSSEDLWKRSEDIIKEYPIVLSTTFASRSCLKDVMYDYLIMDEASQVDITTGALALSSAKNAVIVGDLKQLPNVIKDDMKSRSNAVFNSYNLPPGYSFSDNSFLKSVCNIIVDAPQTLLREHYRCHPKIIGFCNQKFYNNELLIMTEDHGEHDTLSVIKSNVGNHRRDHINQRQIDITIKEALPMLKDAIPENIGIIAPYKDQVIAITEQLDTDKIEVNTVHKYQGREKDTIVLTTVDDVTTDFSDDPNLLNVAVSRAKSRLCLIVSGNEQPTDSNIGDLISYIEYNNFQIVHSEIYSVFDLLYKQYTDARIAFLKRHSQVSEYDSENLMYGAIVDLLNKRPQMSLNIICHQPINMLIRDPKHLNDEECRYAMNTATHIDFLIYNRISKRPVLAIEVDGFHNHKLGTAQYVRDRMKDHILEVYKIPLLRLPTNGSAEMERIRQALDASSWV